MIAPVETILLAHPVEIGGVMRSTIDLRAPTREELRALQRMNASAATIGTKLMTWLAAVSRADLDKIEIVNPGTKRTIERYASKQARMLCDG